LDRIPLVVGADQLVELLEPRRARGRLPAVRERLQIRAALLAEGRVRGLQPPSLALGATLDLDQALHPAGPEARTQVRLERALRLACTVGDRAALATGVLHLLRQETLHRRITHAPQTVRGPRL